MTNTIESAAEIRETLNNARSRLEQLEARHAAATAKAEAARTSRAALLAAEPGTYRPELAAEIDATEAERDALADALWVAGAEIAATEARLKEAETREKEDNGERLRVSAIAAWEALEAELMKCGPRLLKLHNVAQAAKAEAYDNHRPYELVGMIERAVPGLEGLMMHARPYLEGESRKAAEQDRQRRELERDRAAEQARRDAENEASVRAWTARPVEERNRLMMSPSGIRER